MKHWSSIKPICFEMHTVEISCGGNEKVPWRAFLSQQEFSAFCSGMVYTVDEYVESHHNGNQYMNTFTLCKIDFNKKVKN